MSPKSRLWLQMGEVSQPVGLDSAQSWSQQESWVLTSTAAVNLVLDIDSNKPNAFVLLATHDARQTQNPGPW